MRAAELIKSLAMACLGMQLMFTNAIAQNSMPIILVNGNGPASTLSMEVNKMLQARNYWGAISKLDSAIRIDPRMADAYYMRACCKQLVNDFVGGVDDCNRAIAIQRANPAYYYQRGTLEYLTQKYDRCIADCDIAIELRPALSQAYLYRGYAKSYKGDRKGALADCNTYLQQTPADPQALKFKNSLLSR